MDEIRAKSVEPSIPSIDGKLANVAGRLSKLRYNLRCSVHGETPNDTENDVAEMPTPSLDSLVRRISDIQDELSGVEALSEHLHS